MPFYKITPCTKPRMTQRDKWLKPARTCVAKYWAFKDQIRAAGVKVNPNGDHIVFFMPMPKSWKPEKKAEMYGKPHTQRPDKDNLEKALLDAIYDEDCHIWNSTVTKIWAYNASILVDRFENVNLDDYLTV